MKKLSSGTLARILSVVLAAASLPACGGGGGGAVLPPALGVGPQEVRVGQEMQIRGPSFGSLQGTSTVTVGGAAATVTLWSENLVKALVPAGAQSGLVQLNVGGNPILPGSIVILWPQVDPQNVAVSTATSDQDQQEMVSDGSGAVIVVWRDLRNGNYDIFAQKMSIAGAPMWTANGIAVCTQTGSQEYPKIASDNAGGAIITWQDDRSGTLDIYAQRVNGSGTPQWTADGVAVCSVAGVQDSPGITADGSGGAVLAWRDVRSGTQIDLYAQQLNSAGAAQWTAGGVAVSTAGAVASSPRIIPDGSGGAILAWEDMRTGDLNLYGQRLNAAGAPQWTPNGVSISTAVSTQTRQSMIPDGSGGAILSWSDYRSGNSDLYAQRINASGSSLWATDGVAICATPELQDFSQLIPDGSGGAILVWEDDRNGVGNRDIFAQRINSSGTPQWLAGGVPVCTAVGNQSNAQIIPDGTGGAVISWEDLRSGAYDVFLQRLDGNGAVQWTVNGVAVSTATGNQQDSRIIPDGSGGAIVTWRDSRSGVDVFAQRVTGLGHQ